MDPIIEQLVTMGPGGIIAAILLALMTLIGIPAFVAIWRLWRSAEGANTLAVANLNEQKVVNIKSELALEIRDNRIKDLESTRDRLEREVETCRGQPRREVTP